MNPRPGRPGAAARKLERAIDCVLQVDFVGWRGVDAYMDQLGQVLDGVRSLGREQPEAGLEAGLYFVEAIFTVFDKVEDEAELGIFCYELVEVALGFWSETRAPLEETGRRLLDAWERDGHLRLAFVPEELAGRRLRKRDREWLVQELGRRRKGTGDRYHRRLLTKALARLDPK